MEDISPSLPHGHGLPVLYLNKHGAQCTPAISNRISEAPVSYPRLSLPGDFTRVIVAPNSVVAALIDSSGVKVVNIATNSVVFSHIGANVQDVSFSPKSTYIVTWESANVENLPNLLVHKIDTGTVVSSRVHRNHSTAIPQWAQDESFYALMVDNTTILFCEFASNDATDDSEISASTDPTKTKTKNISERILRAESSSKFGSFSVSPSKPPLVAVFCPEHSSIPAALRLYSTADLSHQICVKTFFNAQRARFFWNSKGNSALVHYSTDVDRTGKSYYGNSSLFFLNSHSDHSCRVALDRDGPVHDFCWSPNGREFVVVYGYMPTKTALFSCRAIMTFDLGSAPRNHLCFSPNARFLAVGGFGNLPGEIDFWDMQERRKLASVSSPHVTYCEWSPDGRHLLAATLAPRMRVDNGWRVWHYTGVCIAHNEIDPLYQISWCGAPASRHLVAQWSCRALSPPPVSSIRTADLNVGNYVPPALRFAALQSSGGFTDSSKTTTSNKSSSATASNRGSTFDNEKATRKTSSVASVRVIPGANFVNSGSASTNSKRRLSSAAAVSSSTSLLNIERIGVNENNPGNAQKLGGKQNKKMFITTLGNGSNTGANAGTSGNPNSAPKSGNNFGSRPGSGGKVLKPINFPLAGNSNKKNENKKDISIISPSNGANDDTSTDPKSPLKTPNAAKNRERLLEKRLRQISELKKRRDNGITLDFAQLSKISSEASILTELQSIN